MSEGYPAAWQHDVETNPSIGGGLRDPSVGATDQSTASPREYSSQDDGQGKADTAKEQAAAVGQGAAEAGQQVATVAKDQAQNVAAEAGSQAKDLLHQTRSELTEQAGTQQKRLAETLRSLGGELESMGQHSEEPGMATDLVKQASTRAHGAASWLESREPGSLLSELQSFARQRPAAFLALAAGAGLVVGRLGRGVKDASSDDSSSASDPGQAGSSPAPVSVPAGVELGSTGTDTSRPFASSQDTTEDHVTFETDGGIYPATSHDGSL